MMKLGGIEMKELNQLLGIMKDAVAGDKPMEDVIKDLQNLRDELESKIEKHPLHDKYKDMTIAELEAEILKQLRSDFNGSREFDKQLNEQCRNLMMKSGLDLQLPLKRTRINEKQVELDMLKLEEAGFSIGMVNFGMDNMFILEKNEMPIYFFLELHDEPHHAITEIFEIIDGDINETLESIFE